MATRQPKKAAPTPALALDGELTIFRAAELKQALLGSPRPELLDLSGVTEIDTAGLQLLLLARQEALQQQRPLRLQAPSAVVADVLTLLNLTSHFGDEALPPPGRAPARRKH
ncbi:MAG: STAS domain-containing protein [Burkholderiales bacterium]|nr:STAS domain-containing protein [Burkholderiales bacterium]